MRPGFAWHAVLANTTETEYSKEETKLKLLKEWSPNALRREQQVALNEIAILKGAKTHGIAMPANMLQDAGLN